MAAAGGGEESGEHDSTAPLLFFRILRWIHDAIGNEHLANVRRPRPYTETGHGWTKNGLGPL